MQPILINTIVMLGEPAFDQRRFVQELAQASVTIDGVELRQELLPAEAEERQTFFLELLETGTHKQWQYFYSVPQSLFTATGLNPLLEEWLQEAAAFHAKNVKVNIGDLAGIPLANKEQLLALLQRYQVNLTIENDQTEANGRYKPVAEALAAVKAAELPLGYTFDVGNWLVMKEDLAQAFATLAPQTTVLHLKNIDDAGQTTLLDEGSVQWQSYLLPEIPVVLEYPMAFAEIAAEVAKPRQALQ